MGRGGPVETTNAGCANRRGRGRQNKKSVGRTDTAGDSSVQTNDAAAADEGFPRTFRDDGRPSRARLTKTDDRTGTPDGGDGDGRGTPTNNYNIIVGRHRADRKRTTRRDDRATTSARIPAAGQAHDDEEHLIMPAANFINPRRRARTGRRQRARDLPVVHSI